MTHWPLSDDDREEVINLLTQLTQGATGNVRRYFWHLMKDEIELRSPERVAKMEREKGLRAA